MNEKEDLLAAAIISKGRREILLICIIKNLLTMFEDAQKIIVKSNIVDPEYTSEMDSFVKNMKETITACELNLAETLAEGTH